MTNLTEQQQKFDKQRKIQQKELKIQKEIRQIEDDLVIAIENILIDSNSNSTSPYIDAQPFKKAWSDAFINHLSSELQKRSNTTATSSPQNHA